MTARYDSLSLSIKTEFNVNDIPRRQQVALLRYLMGEVGVTYAILESPESAELIAKIDAAISKFVGDL